MLIHPYKCCVLKIKPLEFDSFLVCFSWAHSSWGLWLPYGHLPSEEGLLHKKKHGRHGSQLFIIPPNTHISAQYFFYKKWT